MPEQSGQNLFLLALAGQQFAGLLLQALLLGAGGSQSLSLLCQSLLRIRKRQLGFSECCLLYTSPSPRDATLSRMPSSA